MTVPGLGAFETCAWCPRLCRHVCPVAVGSAREAAVPSNMALQALLFLRGDGSLALAQQAAALCVGCDSCTEHCDLDRPLGRLLRELGTALSAPPPAEAVRQVEGDGRYVAVLSDDRDWSAALAAVIGEPVARLRSGDQLGARHLDHPLAGPDHAAALQSALGDRIAVVTDHRSLRAATRAGLRAVHLVELVRVEAGGPVHHPCQGPRLAGDPAPDALRCCGACADLGSTHPSIARDLAVDQARRLARHAGGVPVRSPDSVCAGALSAAGLEVIDPIDALLASPA